MKAFFLAAGRGTRLSRSIQNIPKCTLPVAGVPLIRLTVEQMLKRGIQTYICVGYQKEYVFTALKGLDVTFYENPFFDVTNSIASLWMMRNEMQGDSIIMNADVYFEEPILDMLIADTRDAVLLSDNTRTEVGDYFFQLDGGRISKYGKDLPLEQRTCEYVGMAKIRATFMPKMVEEMLRMIGQQKHGGWWENALYSISGQHPVQTLDVNGNFWAEVDYFDDYERLLAFIDSKAQASHQSAKEKKL